MIVCFMSFSGATSKLFLASGLGTSNSDIVDLTDSNATCRPLAEFPLKMTGSVGTYFNGKPLICGGNIYADGITPKECYAYDLNSDTWSMASTQLNYGRWFPSSVVLPDGRWLVTGGSQAGLLGGIFYGTEVMSASGTFTEDMDMAQPMENHCVVQIDDNRTVFIGGSPTPDVVWMYDWSDRFWRRLNPLQTGRRGHACGKIVTSSGTKVVVAGGVKGDFLDIVEVLDLETYQWSYSPKLPKPLYGSSMVEFEGGLYMVGGTDDLYTLTDVYKLNPDTLEWSMNEVQLPLPREVFVAIVIPAEDETVCQM